MINLLSSATRPDPAAVARVKVWVFESFQLPEEAIVKVMELRCAEEDCPDVESVIALFGEFGQTRKFKLLKPVEEITREDVCNLGGRPTQTTT